MRPERDFYNGGEAEFLGDSYRIVGLAGDAPARAGKVVLGKEDVLCELVFCPGKSDVSIDDSIPGVLEKLDRIRAKTWFFDKVWPRDDEIERGERLAIMKNLSI